MPELPEVETTRRGIATLMPQQVLRQCLVHQPKMRWPIPPNMNELVQNKTVLACERRGKYLLLRFEHGYQIIHLGMSGSLRSVPLDAPRLKHDHVEWIFDHARFLLHDPRRFGAVLWHDLRDGPILKHPLLAKLGVEPLNSEFNPDYLFQQFANRNASIKSVLLAGQAVVGVGNIYASESLFKAAIDPTAPAKSLSLAQVTALHQAIVETLQQALDSGGSTLRDYKNATGEAGAYFDLFAQIYGKAGQPCPRCTTPIQRMVQNQRATYFCSQCQNVNT
ncbi:DNA-formamidopyrimidine glycosylase [Paenalcaligenes hominis]|uniref:Formamidopyrimidine-DNA glycosylase n=1 Tax=Paenalcaligenes hominis TaxID=643674 RepID=A0A1U9K1M2_9BURK|nr:bifunctional DNA-formamidopyrimidine glycosylase/DNA-(apurinic or apyrimidinic site) lyase [Paenalcaligenes hominis]AQS51927.1 DNA-formamidopyrimidine glycosylase [Paenalcaligenes hominis]